MSHQRQYQAQLAAQVTAGGWQKLVGEKLLTVHDELAVTNNLLDLALVLEIGQRLPGEGAVDLEPVDQGGDGDQAVRLDILLELVVGGLVEDNSVLGLVLNYSAEKGISALILFDFLRVFRSSVVIGAADAIGTGARWDFSEDRESGNKGLAVSRDQKWFGDGF